ncbi:hypothetical protein AAHK90_003499 [Salmonella enterica]
MNFLKAYNDFKESLNGTDSYVVLERNMTLLINEDQRNAAIYFTIRRFAHTYVLLYADQAVTTEFADDVKYEMQQYLNITLQVVNNEYSPERSWVVLNKIIIDYEHSKKIF